MADPIGAILYIVATPIGNLQDITDRAKSVLASVDVVLAEDTRVSSRLLQHLGIKAKLRSFHDYSTPGEVKELVKQLADGQSMALISDAGTPLINDPGFELVRAARSSSIRVVPVPGASAIAAALSVAGLPTDRFSFYGFPPVKGKARTDWFDAVLACSHTAVFYESCHRVQKTVASIADSAPDRMLYLGRELTKTYEQHVVEQASAVSAKLGSEVPIKGEFVLVLAGAEQDNSASTLDVNRLIDALLGELPPSKAAKVLAKITDRSRSECYALLEQRK